MVLFGADRVAEYAHLFIGRTALLTGPSGRTSSNEPTFDALKRCCDLRLLLAPEHGVRGDKPAGAVFADEVDEDTGLTVRSLYTKESKRLSADTLALFDTLVYDVADVGCRYYTFLTSLRYCMEDCAAAGKRLVVLDRPNPLGDRVEGGLLREEAASFVGGYPIPVCYGLTCGELAVMMNEDLGCKCDLHITDETLLQPVALGVKLLDLLRKMYPEDFHFLPPVREDGKPFLSLLAGHRDFEHPDWDAESLLARYRKESEDFRQRKAPYERYPRG